MVVSARVLLALAALAVARAHLASHDNILRIQLWDAEGLSKEPAATVPPTAVAARKSRVNLDSLYKAMVDEGFSGTDFGRFTRHRVRHKRRRPRQIGNDLPWQFHSGLRPLNVLEYDDDQSAASEVARDVSPPMTLRQDDADEEEKANNSLPVVPKCCASGQNLSSTRIDGKRVCLPSMLTFQPTFYQADDTYMWSYDSNLFETIVGDPCNYDRYVLNPMQNSSDEFYLLKNGSLFVPNMLPYLLGTKDYCMETFWNGSHEAGVTLPLICFKTPNEVAMSSPTMIAYTSGLIISVPFLLATACVYLFIRELRDTHGKALACHSVCLAVAFTCLAITQLAGHAFPATTCTLMAYLIQFSFVSCFFWLNVMCFDTYINVKRYIDSIVSRRSMRRRFFWYSVYAILLPILLLIVTVIMDLSPAVPSTFLKPGFGVKGCWFRTDEAALPYFYGPVAALLFANVILFFFTSRAFAVHYDKLKDVTALELTHSEFSTSDDWVRLGAALGETISPQQRVQSPTQEKLNFNQRIKKYRKIFRMCCMLSVIMGLSWVMEVVSWAAGASEVVSVWSVFDVINALQGIVIFGIYVMQQPVRSYIKLSMLCSECRRRSGSELAVVSERTSLDCGAGRRDYV